MASITGTDGADILTGTAAGDTIVGYKGNDVLNGLEGNDALYGDDGADTLDGGDGDDYLYGGGGNDSDSYGDILRGGNGFDRLYGGIGDHFDGGAHTSQGDYAYLNLTGLTSSLILDMGATGLQQIAGADRFAFSGQGQGTDLVRDFSKADDRFDLDGKSFTAAVSDGNGGTTLTWDGGTIRVEKVTGTLAEFNGLLTTGANTLVRLTNAFDNLLRYSPASDTDRAYVQGLTDKVASGQMTETNALKAIVNLADATSAVATTSYAFFTGGTPSEGGMDYLVSPIGPNPNNLNSAYYQSFNAENRYINFAVNLGRDGAGATKFAAEYGTKTLFEATRSAYAKIFGATPDDAKVHALIDTRVDYFNSYGKTDMGAKAAMVGWLLAEAMKADIGMFANASNAYFTDLADGASFAIDLVGQYGKSEYNL